MGELLLAWGEVGARKLARTADALVVVDLLPSNGNRLAAVCAGIDDPIVVATLADVPAVAAAVRDRDVVALIPCGERDADGILRGTQEDLIGAGAVAARLPHDQPAAVIGAVHAYKEAVRVGLKQTLRGTISGRGLIEAGRAVVIDAAVGSDESSD